MTLYFYLRGEYMKKQKDYFDNFNLTTTDADSELGDTRSYGISYTYKGTRHEINEISVNKSDILSLIDLLRERTIYSRKALEKEIDDFLDSLLLVKR